jgi:hypothetical protein
VEREYLLQSASHISGKIHEQEELIASLQTRLVRKEAEVKGAHCMRNICQSKLEQKDLTLIQFGERIQAQREEIESMHQELKELKSRCEMLTVANIEKQAALEEFERHRMNCSSQETETELTGAEISQILVRPQKTVPVSQTPKYATMIAMLKEKAQMIPVQAPPRRRDVENVEPNQSPILERSKAIPRTFAFERFVIAEYATELAAREETPLVPEEILLASEEIPLASVEIPLARVEISLALEEIPLARVEIPLAPEEIPLAPVEIPLALVETQTDPIRVDKTRGAVWEGDAAISEIALALTVIALLWVWIYP